MGVSVVYDTDHGLALASMYEWRGVGVSFNKANVPEASCTPPGGLTDFGGVIQSFDCIIAAPSVPPQMPAGTYRIGTIIWDTSGWGVGPSVIGAYVNLPIDGVIAFIDGNIVDISSQVVVGTHLIGIPEPGTASLLGLALVSLVLLGRRSRTPRRTE